MLEAVEVLEIREVVLALVGVGQGRSLLILGVVMEPLTQVEAVEEQKLMGLPHLLVVTAALVSSS
jgi:hypothetical protein